MRVISVGHRSAVALTVCLAAAGNGLGAEGVRALMPALTTMERLALLFLGGASARCGECAHRRGRGVPEGRWLRAGNKLCDEGGAVLATLIPRLKQLAKLEISAPDTHASDLYAAGGYADGVLRAVRFQRADRRWA